MNVVCVFAHQDDEMRCLGTLLRLRDAGCRIVFVCITRGDKGLPFDPLADAVRVREREMLAVADAFAAEYVCLGREDGFAEDNASLRRDLIRTLRRMRAELIFTHWTADYNDDHVVTAKAVTDAALFAAIASVEPHVSRCRAHRGSFTPIPETATASRRPISSGSRPSTTPPSPS
ncbi:PIG-L deacetylase family protein [Nonomuraea thailandensis]